MSFPERGPAPKRAAVPPAGEDRSSILHYAFLFVIVAFAVFVGARLIDVQLLRNTRLWIVLSHPYGDEFNVIMNYVAQRRTVKLIQSENGVYLFIAFKNKASMVPDLR